MKLAALTLTLMLAGCTFARISVANLPPFFSTPDEPPRRDEPGDPTAALAVLWVGHATTLIQLGDAYVLTDPVFTETVGTLSRRLVAPGLAPDKLPHVDATIVSHRHFDHLSRDTFELVGDKVGTVFTPVGARDDIPFGPYKVHELAWGESAEVNGVRITAMRVVHDGGRVMDAGDHPAAFTGYVIEHDGLTVYFGGDTSYDPTIFTEVRAAFPAIDLAILPIGPIAPADVMLEHHMDPEQALLAFTELGARVMVPIHFSTFVNSYDKAGDCEGALDEAVAKTDLGDSVQRLLIGENRRIVARD